MQPAAGSTVARIHSSWLVHPVPVLGKVVYTLQSGGPFHGTARPELISLRLSGFTLTAAVALRHGAFAGHQLVALKVQAL